MQKGCLRGFGDSPDSTLGYTILVMCTNVAGRNGLLGQIDCPHKSVVGKSAIVAVIMFDLYIVGSINLFKSLFGLHCFV